MPTPTSRLAYSDCYDLMDAALADEIGVRIPFKSRGDAMQARVRLHSARMIDREENMKIYERDHPLYGRSTYDRLIVQIPSYLQEDSKGNYSYFVYVRRIAAFENVELLSGIELIEREPRELLAEEKKLPEPMRLLRRL